MIIQLDSEKRVFQLVRQGFGSSHVFCNLEHIPTVLKEAFEKNDEIKIYEFWNTEKKVVTRKRLNAMFEANQIDYRVKSVDKFIIAKL